MNTENAVTEDTTTKSQPVPVASRLHSLAAVLCFAAFGATGLMNPFDRLNPVYLAVGAVVGLAFGFICRVFFSLFLGLGNLGLRRDHGRGVVGAAIARGMSILVPFAAMSLLAAYWLRWSALTPFVSAGLMTAGVAAAIELGRLKPRPGIRDTILASVAAWVLAAAWIYVVGYAVRLPAYVEGVAGLLRVLSRGLSQ